LNKKPLVIAHRGGSKRAPENTISALKNGLMLQADYVEFDLRFTKDEVPVLFHDDQLSRTTNGSKDLSIEDISLEEAKKLDAGSFFSPQYKGEQIPTFEETLQILPNDTKYFIEIKEPNIKYTTVIVDIIKSFQIEKNVKILSFHQDVLSEVKRLAPELHTVFLFSEFKGDLLSVIMNPHFDSFGLGQKLALIHPYIPKQLLQHEKKVFVYAVNNRYAIRKLCKIGVTGIITDQPLKTRKIIDNMYKKTSKQ